MKGTELRAEYLDVGVGTIGNITLKIGAVVEMRTGVGIALPNVTVIGLVVGLYVVCTQC